MVVGATWPSAEPQGLTVDSAPRPENIKRKSCQAYRPAHVFHKVEVVLYLSSSRNACACANSLSWAQQNVLIYIFLWHVYLVAYSSSPRVVCQSCSLNPNL